MLDTSRLQFLLVLAEFGDDSGPVHCGNLTILSRISAPRAVPARAWTATGDSSRLRRFVSIRTKRPCACTVDLRKSFIGTREALSADQSRITSFIYRTIDVNGASVIQRRHIPFHNHRAARAASL